MKRLIWLPQIVLGLAFAWGGLMGWAAAFASLAWPAVLVYLAAVAWTVGYDTIYALQDIEDDEIAGIKSSARLFGEHVRAAVAACYGLALALLLGSLWLVNAGPAAYSGRDGIRRPSRLAGARDRAARRGRALRLFRSNRDAGLILFAGLSLDAFLRAG